MYNEKKFDVPHYFNCYEVLKYDLQNTFFVYTANFNMNMNIN